MCLVSWTKGQRDTTAPQHSQNYRKSWATLPELKNWLRPVEGSNKKECCVYCKCELVVKLCELRSHAKAWKHIKASEPFTSKKQTKLTFTKVDDSETKKISPAEGHLAIFVVNHTSFLRTDHLSELCKKIFGDCNFTDKI